MQVFKGLGSLVVAALAAAACGPSAAPASEDATVAFTSDGGPDGAIGTASDVLASYPWHDGVDCSAPEPDIVKIAEDTIVFRQPLCVNFEGPFMYLLLGRARALLLDSGTDSSNMATFVLAEVEAYKARHGLSSYELVVAHTHSHGDHVGGDRFFAGKPGVTIVKHRREDVAAFFGLHRQTITGGSLRRWPDTQARFDLGDRVLDVLPLPGHEQAHILVYDSKERLLFTGDTLYPGRLYIEDWNEYRASAQRLAAFVSTHEIRHVLGAHIELRSEKGPDGKALDYPMGEAVHPGEHALVLGPDEATKLWNLVDAQGDAPRREASQSFILFP